MLKAPATIGVSARTMAPPVFVNGYEPPSPVITNQSQGYISFGWNAVSGANAYQVCFFKKENEYTSPVTTTGNTGIEYSGLSAGTYTFFFRSVFGQEKSDYVIDERTDHHVGTTTEAGALKMATDSAP